ncbi:AN1-type zinc finger protein [Elysia marginata]|uniref:AN1-type zinc finger protein n=1 Tax=Elysia marginata TaxID=1093978 RepID=A0AAV4GQY9_9GAST|nr:AN1-type zinc finger protein [Elysia marginata]
MSMEEKGNHQNLGTPTFCRNGCGFYAAQAFDGMCSKCYKDVKQQLQQPGGPVVQTSSPAQSPLTTSPGGPQVDEVDAVAVALSRTSLGEMNVNSSSNNPHPGSPSSSSESLATTSEKLPGGAVGGTTSEVETASPTVPTVSASAAKTGTAASTAATASSPTTEESSPAVGSADGFVCHCGKLFCGLHRYSDQHECTFDFREKGQEEIRRNNPVIKGEKIQKI